MAEGGISRDSAFQRAASVSASAAGGGDVASEEPGLSSQSPPLPRAVAGARAYNTSERHTHPPSSDVLHANAAPLCVRPVYSRAAYRYPTGPGMQR